MPSEKYEYQHSFYILQIKNREPTILVIKARMQSMLRSIIMQLGDHNADEQFMYYFQKISYLTKINE